MRCPFCGDEANRVIDSRLTAEGQEIRRRRECMECQRRFSTRERVEERWPRIIKRDERREDYAREKMLSGVERACEKRPIATDAIERLLDRIERRLVESGEREISSSWLGERAMEELIALDSLAAVRFASVFQDFQRAEDYDAFFASLDSGEGDGGS
ncbi:MAG: transcriptional regulator NrdR [Myxococcota bacterium]|nr:transcriptional regulator NrdR [Myxococcota bacterium]